MSEGGKKNDSQKLPLDLIPREALESMAAVLGFGASKYAKHQWLQGISYSRLIAADMRHTAAFNSGEDLDPESGLSHVGHSLCCKSFLAWMIVHRPDLDDRGFKEAKTVTTIRYSDEHGNSVIFNETVTEPKEREE